MILHGRYHSPFVRRIAIWLNLQDRPFEHRPVMVTGDDYARLREINPIGRVPALQLDDGTTLVETSAIIDWIEETAPENDRLLPSAGVDRMRVLQGVACANSLAEKAVALVYESVRRPDALHWAEWIERIEGQITAALDLLEAHCPDDGFAGGAQPNGADIAAVAGFDFVVGAFPRLVDGRYPRLGNLSKRANSMTEFSSTRPS